MKFLNTLQFTLLHFFFFFSPQSSWLNLNYNRFEHANFPGLGDFRFCKDEVKSLVLGWHFMVHIRLADD